MKRCDLKRMAVPCFILTMAILPGFAQTDSAKSSPGRTGEVPFAAQFPGSLIYPPPVADAEIHLTIKAGKITEYRLVPVIPPDAPVASVPSLPMPTVPVFPGDSDPGRTGEAVGHAWVTILPATFADSFATAANEVENNTSKPMASILKDHVSRWQSLRLAEFDRLALPILNPIIPAGTDNPTADQRKRYAAAMRAIVKGMKGN